MDDVKTKPSPVINLIDESFDSKKSNSYHLSILANENSFSFSINDTNTNKYLIIQSGIRYPVSGTQILKHNFKSVSCAIAHNKFTLIPNALFNEENKESLLGFNHPVENDEEILVNTFHSLEAKNIFTVSKSFKSAISKHFVNVHFIHSATSFIEGLLVQNKNNSGKKVFADFHSDYLEVIILDGRELLFSNAFKYKTPEDIAYYILFVYEQLHLNPEKVELVLSGKIEKTAKEHSLLYTYIRHVKFASFPEGFKYSYKFEEVHSHNFWTLFTQYLCV